MLVHFIDIGGSFVVQSLHIEIEIIQKLISRSLSIKIFIYLHSYAFFYRIKQSTFILFDQQTAISILFK